LEEKTNYTMVGIMVVVLLSALLGAALWLSVGFDQKKYKIYAVFFHEAVSGLNEESPVKYNGVKVGTVYKIELNRVDPQEVRILLNIEDGTPVTTGTTATLISQGITGNTFIGLAANSSDLTPLQKIPKEPYPIIPSRPSLFNQLDRVMKDVSENVNSVSIRLKKILSDENTANITKSLASLQAFTQVMAEHSNDVARILKNGDTLVNNMAVASKDLPQVIKELKVSLNKLTIDVSRASQNVSSTMQAGKLAIDKISDQTIPPAVSLLHQLNNIAANIEKLSVQMRQNPSVIIRGSAPPAPGPGE
jgi:phospholipid/cholesterol/gamma-HCH transport system substrate-binding protein